MAKIHVHIAFGIAYINDNPFPYSLYDLSFFEDPASKVVLTDPEKIKAEFERRYKGQTIKITFE